MNQLTNIPGTIWTNKQVFYQDIPNSNTPFNVATYYQDFFLFGMPANHIVIGTKISTVISFVADANVATYAYVGLQGNLGTTNDMLGTVTPDNTKLFGMANLSPLLNSPSSPDSSYNYGSFRWFSVAAPGNYQTTGPYCLTPTINPFDIYVRFVTVQTGSGGIPNINGISAGMCEITVQYQNI